VCAWEPPFQLSFGGGCKKSVPSLLHLVGIELVRIPGLCPGIFSAVPFDELRAVSAGTVPGSNFYPGLASWATFSQSCPN
jgi:hypothetical protein